MADYISKFTGQQIDAAIQKATDIAKTATDINSNLAYTEGLKTNLNTIADNEIVSKKSDGSLQGTGILNESDKIFFPKDGRFPSGSIDIGPAATLSENGGWLQYKANTLGKDYILLDYENDETGSKRPVYWERAAEEKGHVVNNVDSTAMNNITTFNHIPTANSQVNALYLNFATDVSNFMAEIVSLNTGKPIKYIPNENAWKTNVGGLNLASGVRNILQNISPISLLTAYNLKINFKANNPINLKGDGTKPYLMVDRQLITAKPIALQGEGTGSADTPSQIRDKLSTLSGNDRLDASKIKNIPSGGGITVGQTYGDYRQQSGIEDLELHEPLGVTFDPDGKTAGLSISPTAYANKNVSNVLEEDFDQKFKETQTYKTIWERLPQLKGVKAKYIEQQDALTSDQFNTPEQIIHIVYQIASEDQNIQQTLPSASIDKVLIIQMIYSTGITNGSVILTPYQGEQFDGKSAPYIIDHEGMAGIAFSDLNNWDFIPYESMHEVGIGVNDQKSNFFIGMKDIAFGNGFTATQDPNSKTTVKIDYQGSGGITFVDGLSGGDFTASKIQSIDKSVRISKIADGVADFSRGLPEHNSGIHVCLGNDELLNSKYQRAKLYFSDTKVKGDSFVYFDADTKSYIIQDVDPQDDPNVSGGTTFIIALYYEPNPDIENVLTQDGAIELEFVDDADNPILDVNGKPMGSKIDYKAGDLIKPELYIGECQAKAFTRVHLKIKMNFANEEIISVGANTQLCIQAINKNESSGLALLSFIAFTGYRLSFDTKYYGYNSLNMSQYLIFNQAETDIPANTIMNLGNNTYLNFVNKAKLSISNYHLVIKDAGGLDLPVWSISKVYDKLDSKYISGKKYKVTTTLTDKDDAFDVALLKYTGTVFPAPNPKVERYFNENPIFTSDWVVVDSMFISEEPVIGDHTQSKEFTIPNDSTGIAILMYPHESQQPCTLQLKDLEGDITPWFNKLVISDTSHISEEYLNNVKYIYKSIVNTPNGFAAYRYTCNNTDTKVPIGLIKGGDGKIINDNAWADVGATDPNKVQGDLKFLVEGNVEMSYTAKCYNEQGSLNQIEFWLAKVEQGGTFTEVPNSRIATTIEANRNKPKMITSKNFTFTVEANESYRMFMKSDKADGFYIQSKTDGVPLFESIINFDELNSYEKDTLNRISYLEESANEVKFMNNGKEVYNKMLEYDIATGKMKVIDK